MLAWVRLVVRPYAYVGLQRLLGKVSWLGRPRSMAGAVVRSLVFASMGPSWGLVVPPSSHPGAMRGNLMSRRVREQDSLAGAAGSPLAY